MVKTEQFSFVRKHLGTAIALLSPWWGDCNMAWHRGRFVSFLLLLPLIAQTGCGLGSGGDLGANRYAGYGSDNGWGNSTDDWGFGDDDGNKKGLGSGRNDGSGAGSESNRARGRFGDVTMIFFGNMYDHPGYSNWHIPFRLKFAGPTGIYNLTCVAYDVYMVNYPGHPTPYDAPVAVDFSDDGKDDPSGPIAMGGFYKDAGCSTPAVGMRYEPGQTKLRVYYRVNLARIALLKADGYEDDGDLRLMGRYRINVRNNPNMFKPLFMSFEDKEYSGGDDDHNDIVIRLSPGDMNPMYYDADQGKVFSYARQSVTVTASSTSGCTGYFGAKVRNKNGTLTQTEDLRPVSGSASLTVNLEFMSSVEFLFISPGCDNRLVNQNDHSVIINDAGRTPADEGQSVGGNAHTH